MKKIILFLALAIFGAGLYAQNSGWPYDLVTPTGSDTLLVWHNDSTKVMTTSYFDDNINDSLTALLSSAVEGIALADSSGVEAGSYLTGWDAAEKAPIDNPTFTGAIGIGGTDVDETELSILEGATTSTNQFNFLNNTTSDVQTQINSKDLFGVDAQADDDYEVTIAGIFDFVLGMMVTFTANTANTDGATFEITGIGDVDAILKMHDQALVTGDIEAGQVVVCVWDGTNWQMTSQIAQ